MVLPSSRSRAAIAAASFAVTAVLATTATSATAHAAETDDPRAIAVDGNASTCAGAGLSGTIVDESDLEFTGGQVNSDTALSITGVADGLDVTGIVVKGGDAYNVYQPGERGLAADVPWEKLVAPINNGGQQPELSHWFVCAEGTPSTTEPPTTTTEPPATTTTEPSSSEPPAGTEPPSSSEPSTTTPGDSPSDEPSSSEPAGSTCVESTSEMAEPADDAASTDECAAAGAEPATEDDDLALTGFGAAWLIPVGVLLLIGGGAALWLARSRRMQA